MSLLRLLECKLLLTDFEGKYTERPFYMKPLFTFLVNEECQNDLCIKIEFVNYTNVLYTSGL